jgi:outer membrane protein assembly factor BamB
MAIRLRESSTIRIARGPIVLDGPVLTGTSIFTGESSEFVVRLDKRRLKEVWRKKKMAWVRSAHGDKILIYAGETKETQLWDEDGKVLWTRRGNFGRKGDPLFLNEGGRLQVIDVLTGKAVDEFDCPPGTPNLMHDGVLLLRHPEGWTDPVMALDLSSRRVLWEKSLIPEIRGRYQDACPEGLVFVTSLPGQFVASSGQHLVSVSLSDGSLRWGVAVRVPYLAVPVVAGRIYAWTTGQGVTTTKTTLDLSSGQVARERSQPAAGENRFVIVDEATGDVLVDRPLAPYGGSFERFQEPQDGTLCKEHVVFTTRAGLMAGFRLLDGELVWQHQHRAQLFSPVFEDNRLYVACADGTLVVFEAEGGEL